MGGRGSEFDTLRFARDFRQVVDDVDRLKTIAGISGAGGATSVVHAYSLEDVGAVIAADTDGTYSFGSSLTVRAATLAGNMRLTCDFLFRATPQTFPWSFALSLVNGSDVHPVSDAEVIDPTPTPTADGMLGHVRFVGTLRGAPGAFTLFPDSFCAWYFPGGTTNRWQGISVNSNFSTLPSFTGFTDLVLDPQIAVTGATAGDTIQLLSMSVVTTEAPILS